MAVKTQAEGLSGADMLPKLELNWGKGKPKPNWGPCPIKLGCGTVQPRSGPPHTAVYTTAPDPEGFP